MASIFSRSSMPNLPVDSMQQTLVRNPDGTLNYIQATDGVSTWRQTYTWTAGVLTAISAWVKQ